MSVSIDDLPLKSSPQTAIIVHLYSDLYQSHTKNIHFHSLEILLLYYKYCKGGDFHTE